LNGNGREASSGFQGANPNHIPGGGDVADSVEGILKQQDTLSRAWMKVRRRRLKESIDDLKKALAIVGCYWDADDVDKFEQDCLEADKKPRTALEPHLRHELRDQAAAFSGALADTSAMLRARNVTPSTQTLAQHQRPSCRCPFSAP
jgi:hypothetical protein